MQQIIFIECCVVFPTLLVTNNLVSITISNSSLNLSTLEVAFFLGSCRSLLSVSIPVRYYQFYFFAIAFFDYCLLDFHKLPIPLCNLFPLFVQNLCHSFNASKFSVKNLCLQWIIAVFLCFLTFHWSSPFKSLSIFISQLLPMIFRSYLKWFGDNLPHVHRSFVVWLPHRLFTLSP